jgi:hypothetical protein
MLNRRHFVSLTGTVAAIGALSARLALADATTDALKRVIFPERAEAKSMPDLPRA